MAVWCPGPDDVVVSGLIVRTVSRHRVFGAHFCAWRSFSCSLCRYVVLGMQFLQMLIMMNFFYYYLKSAAIGGDMELPLPTHLAAV